MTMHDSSTRAWDRIADDWVRHADANDYRNRFLMPLMLAMIADVDGRSVLDPGCGEGGYSRERSGIVRHGDRHMTRVPYFLFMRWHKPARGD